MAWVFFRAESVDRALIYLKGIFNKSLFSLPDDIPNVEILLCVFLILIEWKGRENKYGFEFLVSKWPIYLRWIFYVFLILMLIYFGAKEQNFIYFQF